MSLPTPTGRGISLKLVVYYLLPRFKSITIWSLLTSLGDRQNHLDLGLA